MYNWAAKIAYFCENGKDKRLKKIKKEEFSSEVKKLTSKPPTRSGLSICRSGSGRQSVSGPWQDNACCCRWL